MKKLILTLAAIIIVFPRLEGQKPEFAKGSRVFNLGLGIGTNLYRETYYNTMIPPVSVSFEIGATDHILEKGVIGVGGYLGASTYKYKFSNNGWNITDFIIGVRGNFHYPLLDNLDTYTGIMIGYGIVGIEYFGSYDENDYTGSSGGIQWAWFIGGRYYFRENWAAMLELGYGVSYLNIGIAWRF